MDDSEEPGEVAYGLRDVLLSQGDEWRTIGYDLDCLTTTSDSPASECTPPLRGPIPVDGVNGIDNQFGVSLYPIVETVIPGLEDRARAAQMAGNGLPILRMRRWNRTPNDPRIDVTITAAVFSTTFPGDTPPTVVINGPTDYHLEGGGAVPPPAWDGNDWTWVRSDSFLAGDPEAPLVRDPSAYIVDGVVVASLPERVDIVFPTDTVGVLVRLTGAVATGTLSADMTRLENVIVSGRWAITDLLSTAENVGVCRADPRYAFLETQLRRTSDVLTRSPEPGDPPLECDSMSLGVRFTGYRMRIAGVTDGLEILNVCLTDAGVPVGDSGTGDAGVEDAGAAADDAGPVDSGSAPDVGVDAGVDAGPRDAG